MLTATALSTGNAAAGGVLLLILILAALAIYFLPTIIAGSRHHHQVGAVFAINLLLGWTLIGWAVALAMGMSAKRQPPVIIQQIVGGAVAQTALQPSPQAMEQPGTQAVSLPAPSAPADQPMAPPTGPPAGWYSDPQTPGQMRRWDGTEWTGDVRRG